MAPRAWALTSALAGSLALLSASGCVSQGELLGPPYELVVLDRVGASGDEFELRRGRLSTVDDFDQLAAPGFRIRQAGVLTAEELHGDMVVSGSFEGDTAPTLRYVVENGVAVPRDYSTLLMFSAAYQFETVLAGLRAALTPSAQSLMDERGAVDVIVGPVMRARIKGVEASVRMDTNAFFFAPGWQFGLAQSSSLEKAPLAADSRVIAHELGHAVFQTAFAGGVSETCDAEQAAQNEQQPWFEGRIEEELVISGLNEGLADWISFAVTGGLDPITSIAVGQDPDLDQNVAERALTDDNFRWSNIVKEAADASADERCDGKYCIGTLFARSLVATYREQGNELDDAEARERFSREVVAALEGTLARMKERELPLPRPELARCELRDEVSSEQDPPVIGAFLRAFLEGTPDDTAALLCRQLEERFEEGFPAEFREECEP